MFDYSVKHFPDQVLLGNAEEGFFSADVLEVDELLQLLFVFVITVNQQLIIVVFCVLFLLDSQVEVSLTDDDVVLLFEDINVIIEYFCFFLENVAVFESLE